jgi:hypothetical protein
MTRKKDILTFTCRRDDATGGGELQDANTPDVPTAEEQNTLDAPTTEEQNSLDSNATGGGELQDANTPDALAPNSVQGPVYKSMATIK